MVAPRVGFTLDERFHASARTLTVLYTALLLEPGFWPEQTGPAADAWERWEKLYDAGIDALVKAIAADGGDEAEDPGPGDDGGRPRAVGGFPQAPAYGSRDALTGAYPAW
jgi:hypothetical protein